MAPFVSQILLPVVLAFIMLGMGMGLTLKDFAHVARKPKASVIGLALQLLFLPAFALVIIAILPLSPAAAGGLFLVSLCPGGATSNLFSFIVRGDVALSVSLTGVVSLISPFFLPLAFVGYLQFSGGQQADFALPLLPAVKQLAIVTLLPIFIGMVIRHAAADWCNRTLPLIKRISTISMISIVVLLMATNLHVMQNLISINAIAVLVLSTGSMFIAYTIAKGLKLNEQAKRTIAIEVGVQNAGTAMMVALAIMHQPALAFVPLMYGLLMNIPAFGFVYWLQARDKATGIEAVTS